MEFDINVDQIDQTATGINNAIGPLTYLLVILAVAGIGRMIFVAYGDKLQLSALYEGFSGKSYVVIFAAICAGLVMFTDQEVRIWIKFKSTMVDPVLTDVLKRDSCNPETNRFCVVVWEDDGREMVVNWHDRRVDAFKVFGGYQFTLFESPRPVARPEGVDFARADLPLPQNSPTQ